MSVEPQKVWQVIRYIDNINGDDTTQHVKTSVDDEDEDDSYNHLIEEQDIISYDSESSTSAQLMEAPTATITRPAVLDLATKRTTDQPLQLSPRLVYVKLGDSSSDHVITTNRPTVDDLNRILGHTTRYIAEAEDKSTNGAPGHPSDPSKAATPSISSANDEELTSLTWLQDKNLIQGECDAELS